MSAQRSYFPQCVILMCSITVLAILLATDVYARDINIAFIEDGLNEPVPRMSQLIVQELQPLLSTGDTLVPLYLGSQDSIPEVMNSLAQAQTDSTVEFIVATGFIGSQQIYQEARFPKPTYLLRVLDPNVTGVQVRDQVRNLQSYSTVNEMVDVFERISDLFEAKRVGILLPAAALEAQQSISTAVAAAAERAGIDAQFLVLDFERDIESQLIDLDAVILPPITTSKQASSRLLEALQRKKIPSFAVGGDSMVLNGALISDTLDEDERVLARRVALDLQLVISRKSRTQGLRKLDAKKRTTINIDTARALDFDFTLDELLTARVVQGNSRASTLGFLVALDLASNRNPALRGQFQQIQIDEESLEQARASRRPQLSAQLEQTRRGQALPEQDTLAAIALSQTLYSPSANANVDVAKLGLMSSKKTLEQKHLDTVQQTATVYFQALQTQAQFESSLRDLTLNRENLSLATQRKRSGSGTGAEIYRWQAIIANSESSLLRAYTANTTAQSQLAQLLNLRMEIPATLADVELDQPPFDLLHEGIQPYLISTGRMALLREASAKRALAQSPQLESASANIAISDTLLKSTRRSYYIPELSISAQYAQYLDSTVNAAGEELDDENDWSVALTAQLRLWDSGTRRSLLREYSAQGKLADTQMQSLQIALWANSSNAVNNLVANYRSIGLSNQAEQAALKSQQITQSAYKLGAASVTELLDTQNEYREAQDNANIARYQYLTALVDFQVLMGELPMLQPGSEQQQWLLNFKQSMLDEAAQ